MMAENKVYYGEYTLKHWIDLILTGDIILPKYQRFFVWDKDKSKALVKALVENQFVPPVTIGSYVENGKKQNLILDGQQRLTSILLAYLNLFPQKDQGKIKVEEVYFASENDEANDDEIDFINWDFNQLLTIIKERDLREKSEIHDVAISLGFENMDSSFALDKFDNCYLGFSFIVPATTDSKEQQKFYSKVFRSINIEGKKLLPLESREALYYLNKDLVGLFSPEFAKSIYVNEGKLDFVRYLSLLSQYTHVGLEKIARGYTKTMEVYYEKFIYSVVDDIETKEFARLSSQVKELDYNSRMNNLKTIVEGLGLIKEHDSIIEIDLYMFGIVFCTIFENKNIPKEKYVELSSEIEAKIVELKGDSVHAKNPSALKHLKTRIQNSISICERYSS